MVNRKHELCPRCGFRVHEDEIACTRCRLVLKYFCDECNHPIPVILRYCTRCGAANPRFNPDLAKDMDGQPSGSNFSARETKTMEEEFEEECKSVAREIEELKETLGCAGMEEVLMHWKGEVLIHSSNNREPIHVGLGTNPTRARGIPGLIILTSVNFVFISHLHEFEGINDIFAFAILAMGNLSEYTLGVSLENNRLIFTSHGMFLERFQGGNPIIVNFTWSTATNIDGSPELQARLFRSHVEAIEKEREESIQSFLQPGLVGFHIGKQGIIGNWEKFLNQLENLQGARAILDEMDMF